MAAIRDPRIMKEWAVDIYDVIVHFGKWVFTGVRLFSKNVGISYFLVKQVALGYNLSVRDRRLLVRTTADCFKVIPFSFFIIVPFAELALPIVLRFFPNLMPSTFFESKYDNATLARKLEAKQQMAAFWQNVVVQRTQQILDADDHQHANKAAELQAFQEKLMGGTNFPSVKEIKRFSTLFRQDISISTMSPEQLRAMAKMLGLQPMTLPVHNKLQLRHHVTSLRREDRDYLWEGIEGLTKPELIEACKKRAIRFHDVTDAEMRRELARWLEISMHKQIPTSLLLWIQSFYLTSEERISGSLQDPTLPDPREFQVKVEPTQEEEEMQEPKEAFHNMAERRKKSLEDARHRLEDLQHEIEEVEAEKKKCVDDGEVIAAEAKVASEHTPMAEEQEEKRCILKRIDEISKTQELSRTIIDRQREMLRQQLEFMAHMRDNAPERSTDANRVLLDQRVRLVEAMGSYSKNLQEIEELLNVADHEEVEISFKEADKDWITTLFNQLDVNKDGVISRREFEKAARILEKPDVEALTNVAHNAKGGDPVRTITTDSKSSTAAEGEGQTTVDVGTLHRQPLEGSLHSMDPVSDQGVDMPNKMMFEDPANAAESEAVDGLKKNILDDETSVMANIAQNMDTSSREPRAV
jgi:hypothetical protein